MRAVTQNGSGGQFLNDIISVGNETFIKMNEVMRAVRCDEKRTMQTIYDLKTPFAGGKMWYSYMGRIILCDIVLNGTFNYICMKITCMNNVFIV